ncbi:hypothetical protein [Mycoplasmopsis cynos]|uniref:hypothetical protein n=1 Tax=Mycoplasmopsis cynos TaxID=171284 RepID=UPI0024CA0EDE|nr:hypothetical protein [Mycoplasmopsis cynos]WAM08805.1 hypothetical protein ONA03_00050 [Mycoplasmopsis cynos]
MIFVLALFIFASIPLIWLVIFSLISFNFSNSLISLYESLISFLAGASIAG